MAAVEDIFKALGDPTRIQILRMLAQNGEMCVCKIMEELAMTQPAVSHHLSKLKSAGLVHHRKEGQWVHYSLCCSTLSDDVLSFAQGLLERVKTCTGGTCK
ncbi:MAG TPA: metalloregulator ArsR/SmtB family transcription factor [Armatimonadota bacterium]|nr:metalloregulator ArsR/SmtB family transcription factor [Armatimonadota bacterium]